MRISDWSSDVCSSDLRHNGVKPANFLDIGGGASATVMAAGLDVILGDEQVKSVFVNVFGGITSCVAVAEGIVKALEILGDTATKPRSEEHTSELQSLMRNSYAVFCLKKNKDEQEP